MRIDLKLMGLLKDKAPAGGGLELPDGATVADLFGQLDVPLDSAYVVSINGSLERDRQHQLTDGDQVTIIPPVGGG